MAAPAPSPKAGVYPLTIAAISRRLHLPPIPMPHEYEPTHEELASVIVCDMNGIVQTYAAGASQIFQWKPEEVIGKMSVASFHLPENVPTLVPRLLQTAVEKGKFEEKVTLQRKDGSRFEGILTVRPKFKDGSQVGFMGFTRPL
jgi:PAS domain S-box-containing protein